MSNGLLLRANLGALFRIVFNVAVGNEFRVYADSGLGVESQFSGAALLTWVQSVHAEVEHLAGSGVSVAGVGLFGTIAVELLCGGAFETISQGGGFVGAGASIAGGIFGPDADSFVAFEDQVTGAREGVLFTINAGEDQVASLLLGVVEETVSSWAVVDGPSRLKFFTTGAVNEVRQVAFVLRASVWVEDEPIFAEHLLGNTVDADEVFVALGIVGNLIGYIGCSGVNSGALELGSSECG